MNVKICITGWRRPYYFKEVIKALEKCININNYSFLISVDWCGDKKKQKRHKTIFKNSKLSKLPHQLYLHPERMGCAGNVGFAFKTAFSDPTIDAIIMLEDDTVPSADYLNFTSTLLERYKDDDTVFSISGYVPHRGPSGNPNKLQGRKWFTSQGWATWRRINEEIGDQWFGIKWNNKNRSGVSLDKNNFFKYIKKTNKGSWAIPMNIYWRNNRREIGPDVSRIQNIGAKEGMFNPNPEWHKRKIHVKFWMGDGKYDVEKLYEYKF